LLERLEQNSVSLHDKKNRKKLGKEGMCFNIIKAAFEKLTANFILNKKKLKPFSLKPVVKHGIQSVYSHFRQGLNFCW
jgi:hypothetical protein